MTRPLSATILVSAIVVIAAWLFAPQPASAGATRCLPPSLKKVLTHIGKNYGKVRVMSAYRKSSIIAGTRNRSKHASCQAVDFQIAGNRKAAIRWLRKQKLEVITYSGGMHHVHVAVGSYKGHHVVDKRGRRIRR